MLFLAILVQLAALSTAAPREQQRYEKRDGVSSSSSITVTSSQVNSSEISISSVRAATRTRSTTLATDSTQVSSSSKSTTATQTHSTTSQSQASSSRKTSQASSGVSSSTVTTTTATTHVKSSQTPTSPHSDGSASSRETSSSPVPVVHSEQNTRTSKTSPSSTSTSVSSTPTSLSKSSSHSESAAHTAGSSLSSLSSSTSSHSSVAQRKQTFSASSQTTTSSKTSTGKASSSTPAPSHSSSSTLLKSSPTSKSLAKSTITSVTPSSSTVPSSTSAPSHSGPSQTHSSLSSTLSPQSNVNVSRVKLLEADVEAKPSAFVLSVSGQASSSSRPTTLETITKVVTPSASSSQRQAAASSSALAQAAPSCGAVQEYYGQKQQDWAAANMDWWLNDWVGNHVQAIADNQYGFTGAFAQWAIGNPDFSCRDDGSANNCDFNPCNLASLNSKGNDTRQSYYMMESLTRIHSYFSGLSQAFSTAAIASALSKDNWATTFYKDKNDQQVQVTRELLIGVQVVAGLAAAFAGFAGMTIAIFGGAAAVLFSGAIGSAGPLIGQHADDTFSHSADLGAEISRIVVQSMEQFTSANNILMHGQNYLGSGDLRDYLRNGSFVAFPGINKNAVVDAMNAFLTGQAVNALWRQQKVFILGGGACGDNQGLGSGPQDAVACIDGKAWYLYFWQEETGLVLNMHKWGHVDSPPGADQLGKGVYADVTVKDAITSSVASYHAAGYNYTSQLAISRAHDALKNSLANPLAVGPGWEGVFTVPVCDIGPVLNLDIYAKQFILQPYGEESRPMWCGPVCSGDHDTTAAFIHAANMDNFQSPVHMCGADDDNYTLPNDIVT